MGGVDFLGNSENKADLWPVQWLDDGSLEGHAKEMGEIFYLNYIRGPNVFVFLSDFPWMVGQTRQLWSSTDTYPADIHKTHGRCAMLLSHSLTHCPYDYYSPGCLNSFFFLGDFCDKGQLPIPPPRILSSRGPWNQAASRFVLFHSLGFQWWLKMREFHHSETIVEL